VIAGARLPGKMYCNF